MEPNPNSSKSPPLWKRRKARRAWILDLLGPHLCLTTSAVNGGMHTHLRHLVNHQSCEGKSHDERHEWMLSLGPAGYHEHLCRELELKPGETAVMGTAANMDYTGHSRLGDEELEVCAWVTAGVQGNAARAGDPARWSEGRDGWRKVAPFEGTINTVVHVSKPLTEAALTRAAVTITEAKSAALEETSVRSRTSGAPATGTGTDQFCLAAPLEGGKAFTWSGTHTRLGELLGKCVLRATKEALRWQNGLEPSLTRNVFHILQGLGLEEMAWNGLLEQFASPQRKAHLIANREAVLHDPRIAACAWTIASLMDKLAQGTLPPEIVREQASLQAALLVAQMGECLGDFAALHREIRAKISEPLDALALGTVMGWERKWS